MPLNKGKHIIAEIDGVRCSVVETGAAAKRMEFLKEILTLNKYEVKVVLEEKKEGVTADSYTIGVTDFLFNPVIEVYKRRLKSKTGHKITPAYWLQTSSDETEAEVTYWTF
jgi:hypothetical protein